MPTQEVAIRSWQTYEAISYCWRDPQDITAIRYNGNQLRIPFNLAAALRGLQQMDEPHYLWADAICINQSDPLDKAMQVPAYASHLLPLLTDAGVAGNKGRRLGTSHLPGVQDLYPYLHSHLGPGRPEIS